MESSLLSIFSFKGRISRSTFWIVFLVLIVWGSLFSRLIGPFDPDNPMDMVSAVMTIINFILVVWITLANQTKRLRNMGKSPLWLLLNLIPVVGSLIITLMCGFLRGASAKSNEER